MAATTQNLSPQIPPRSTRAKPLLIGNWPDPTVVLHDGHYYMTHSSFESQTGLLLWRSRDLLNWKPVARAAQSQKGSIWAPDLIKHNGRFYLYYPAAGENWVVTADSPEGPWSEPVPIGAPMIDPGHVVGDDGKRYIHLSGGHAVEMSDDGLKATSTPRKVYEGWPIPDDWAIECFCLESPKLLKRNGWFYLTSAEGGTTGPSTSHLVCSARSRGPLGPWENSPHNPIIRTWRRNEAWWSKGHGTILEGPDGRWYCILHGIMNGYRSLGRCTLIEPIEWTVDGWFRAAEEWPAGWDEPARAEMELSDDFRAPQLGIQWQIPGRPGTRTFEVGGGQLRLPGHGAHPGVSHPLCVQPLHRAYEIEVEVEIEPGDTAPDASGSGAGAPISPSAGLMLFASSSTYLGLSISPDGVLRRVQQGCRDYRWRQDSTLGGRRARLRIVNDKQDIRFYYQDDAGAWRVTQPGMEISAWGACHAALFACGGGSARFHNFSYRPLETPEELERDLR